MVTVVNDIVPIAAHDAVWNMLTSDNDPPPWYYLSSSSGSTLRPSILRHDYGFYHMVYDNGGITSPFLFNAMQPEFFTRHTKEEVLNWFKNGEFSEVASIANGSRGIYVRGTKNTNS